MDERRKAVFLDRDGTINADKEYLYKIEDFEFLPGVLEALKLLQEKGYLLIVITNQSGIARGFYEEKAFQKLNKWMINKLADNEIRIAEVYYCPHHPEAKVSQYRVKCQCRKPELGLFEQAARDFNLDFKYCYAIGDKIRDCSICEKTECRGFLIADNEKPDVIENVKRGLIHNVEYAADLYEAAKRISQ